MPRLGVWLLGLVSLLPAAWAAYLLASLDRWAGKGPGFRGAPLWFWVVHLAVFVLRAALLVGYEMHAARHLSPDGGRTKWVVLLMMLSGLVYIVYWARHVLPGHPAHPRPPQQYTGWLEARAAPPS